MVINKHYIVEEKGCKKEYDLTGCVYYQLHGNHFYPLDFQKDLWCYHVVDFDVKDGSTKTYRVMETVEEVEEYLNK